jgi:N-acetylmuramoyl-L-alanine amidase
MNGYALLIGGVAFGVEMNCMKTGLGRFALLAARVVPASRLAKLRAIFLFLLTFFGFVLPFQSGSLAEAPVSGPLIALSGEMAGDEMRVRAVFSFDRAPVLSRLIISNPYRLVIDLPETSFGFEGASPKARGLIADMRYGLMQEGKSRIVLTAKGPFALEQFDVRLNDDGKTWRLIVELSASSQTAFETLLDDESEKRGTTAIAAKGDRIGKPREDASRPFTVVLDAGHGGIDGGARGQKGTEEKDVTLGFARELRELLVSNPKIRVILTRDDDLFLPLAERVRIARQHEADIFVAIHADTIKAHGLRGATVYTNSDTASDDLALAVARNENLSDAVAGLAVESQNAEVSDILIDLMRRETQTFSVNLAKTVLGKFEGKIKLINNPHRSARFMVLRAPDVPSILVELGYLSNPQDERLLNDPKWRAQAAELLMKAVEAYAETHGSRKAAQ